MRNSTQQHVVDIINRSESILILPSSPLDGDSLGASISLYTALNKLGKAVTVICSDPIPEVYQFLPNSKVVGNKLVSSNDFIISLDYDESEIKEIKTIIEDKRVNIVITPKKENQISEGNISFNRGEMSYDLIITVDCAELSQLRSIYENNIEMFQKIPVVNIDHHISNAHYGKINHVDIMAASTTELITPMLEQLSKEHDMKLIDENVATLLLTGIITDTGSFQNANTTPKSFEVASDLIAYGARQQEIIQCIYKTKQLSQLKLWGRVLTKIQTDEKYRVVWSALSQQDFRDTGSVEDETGDIIDELMTNAPGAEIVVLMKERKDSSISVSVRTTSAAIDSSKIAEHFGGGGHTQAAGFRIKDMDLVEAEYKVVDYIKEFQAERLRLDLEEDEIPTKVQAKVQAKEEVKPQSKKKTNGIKPKTPVESPKSKVLYKFEN